MSHEMLIANHPLFIQPSDETCDMYVAIASRYGSTKGSAYQAGDRFKVLVTEETFIITSDEDGDRIFISNETLKCFDRHPEYISQRKLESQELTARMVAQWKIPKPVFKTHLYEESIVEFEFKISLFETDVWRSIAVPSDITFWDLHLAIQNAMGWQREHLHSFETGIIGGRSSFDGGRFCLRIGIPEVENDSDYIPSWLVPIEYYFLQEGVSCLYTYDFGDNWKHEIQLVRIGILQPIEYPACVAGEKACPPEDSGGIYGFNKVRAAFLTKNKTELGMFIDQLDPIHKSSFIGISRKELNETKSWVCQGGYSKYDPQKFEPEQVIFEDASSELAKLFDERGFS
jgi:Plasmid pRiA4b ORF-3-like protein